MIIILSPQFAPAYKAGGPIKSIGGIVGILRRANFKFKVIALDYDIDGTKLDTTKFEENVDYVPKVTIKSLITYFKGSELIWFNTLYSPSFSIYPLLALFFTKKTTVLVSPRGQLLQGALSLKKRMYLRVFKFLLRATGHKIVAHFTNEQELEKSIGTFKEFKTIVLNNPISGVLKGDSNLKRPDPNFVIGYFGRISPIKNIEFILNLLPELDASVSFHIHGAFEDLAYQAQLEKLISTLKISNRVRFCGTYDTNTFAAKTNEVDLMVIPSFSENFCHVFFEAIEVRKIVIASDGLPWEDANKTVKNTIMPLQPKRWIDRIEYVQNLSFEAYKKEQEDLVVFYNRIYSEVQQETVSNFNTILNN